MRGSSEDADQLLRCVNSLTRSVCFGVQMRNGSGTKHLVVLASDGDNPCLVSLALSAV